MTATRVRLGVTLWPQHTTYASLRAAWQQLEALGVETLWTWDHFFPLSGDPNGAHFECWTVLAGMAEVTERVEIGALVSAIGYRNPALLSQMAKTVDHMSAGRLILGLGAGWSERDYREYGYDYGTAKERLAALREGLQIIRARWEVDAPPPLRNPMPILIGGGGEQVTLRLAAQYAQLWNGGDTDAATFARKNRILDERCREIGRDPATIERVARADPPGLGNLPSTPEEFDALHEAGAQHIIMRLGYPWDFAAVERLVAWRDNIKG